MGFLNYTLLLTLSGRLSKLVRIGFTAALRKSLAGIKLLSHVPAMSSATDQCSQMGQSFGAWTRILGTTCSEGATEWGNKNVLFQISPAICCLVEP